MRRGETEGAAEYESKHDYDAYFGFNKVIEKLKELLKNLAEDYTVVILVDELDRCLPEYAIKVLERLHHLTEGNSNIVTVIAVDKDQLLSSVKQIFGFERPEKYLEKFFSFEVKLDCGTVSERISEKYADYFALFDKDIFQFEESFEECLQAIFKDIDIRTQEQLVKKSMLAHRLLFSGKKDYSFMCMEMLLAVMICVHNDESCFLDNPVDATSFDNVFVFSRRAQKPAFAAFFKEKFGNIYFSQRHGFSDEPVSYILPDHADLYGAILFTWYWMHKKHPRIIFRHTQGDAYEPIAKNYEELKKFVETIRMMK